MCFFASKELTPDEKGKEIAEFKKSFEPKLKEDQYQRALAIFEKNCGLSIANAFKLFLADAIKRGGVEIILIEFKKLSNAWEKIPPVPPRIYWKNNKES